MPHPISAAGTAKVPALLRVGPPGWNQGCLRPRDRLLGLIPFYAGLRIGEAAVLDVDDVRLSEREGVLIVRSGKAIVTGSCLSTRSCARTSPSGSANLPTGGRHRQPRPFLNHRGGRLTTRAARDALAALAVAAHLEDEFTGHVLRHTFGTTLVRSGHDLVLVAELMGHRRLETTRGYTRPSPADRERAISSLPTDR